MFSELTVLTWLWHQPGNNNPYTVDHVAIWAAMVRRHLHMPHRIACVTDFDGLPSHIERIDPRRDFEHIRIPTWGDDKPQCLRRLAMYAPDAADHFGDRFVCMDLDCVVSSDITPMFSDRDDFRIAKGSTPGRVYNGSMQMLTAGARAKVYQDFTPERAAAAGRQHLGSDQAWLAYCLGPDEATWSEHDGLCWWRVPSAAAPRITFFPGVVKPWAVAQLGVNDFINTHYRGDRSERCLVLGYGETLWDDVDREVDRPFGAVIASPEAAEHWPGPVLAVANNDDEALRLARMHGFTDLALCGMMEAA